MLHVVSVNVMSFQQTAVAGALHGKLGTKEQITEQIKVKKNETTDKTSDYIYR